MHKSLYLTQVVIPLEENLAMWSSKLIPPTPITSIWSAGLLRVLNRNNKIILHKLWYHYKVIKLEVVEVMFSFHSSIKYIPQSRVILIQQKKSVGGVCCKFVASHRCGPGSIPKLGTYVSWVCGWFSPILWGFFSGSSSFPPSTKINWWVVCFV
jgi:hypothetical protein